MSERMRMWMGRRSDSLAPDIMTDAEVLAEMPMEALVEEIKRRGYGIIYKSKEDPDFDMEKGLQEADDAS